MLYLQTTPSLLLCAALMPCSALVAAEDQPLPIPDQTTGSPYTRTAKPQALARLVGQIAAFDGSRYGYINGTRVRLDDADLLAGGAVTRDGVLYVPQAFAALVGSAVTADAPPTLVPEIADRWVATVTRPAFTAPAGVRTIRVGEATWYALADVAAARGLQVFQDGRGLVAAGATALAFAPTEKALHDSVITLFDTPETLADPEIANRAIPNLAVQGRWQDRATFTPEQWAKYQGPATVWPLTPVERYDLVGFNTALLGSAVPEPGVYPRLLFSPQDLPAIRARLEASAVGRQSLIEIEELFRRSWWDPATDDGKRFLKLVSGDFTGRDDFKDLKHGFYWSHADSTTNSLVTMALWCLLTGDDVLGRKVAQAQAHWCRKVLLPAVEAFYGKSDSEYGIAANGDGETALRGILGLAGRDDLPYLLDFGGKWMTAEEKDLFRRLIILTTYGRRDTHQAGPLRWRENNHATWHFNNAAAALAIEGLPGNDPELIPLGIENIRAFLEYGIDAEGQIFESNGKSGGGLAVLFNVMTAYARRGYNGFGHPHLRKLLQAQAQATSPTGLLTQSSGTFSDTLFSPPSSLTLKAFFPQDRAADYLLTIAGETPAAEINHQALRDQIKAGKHGRMRLPGPTYPGFTRRVIFDVDWQRTTREDLGLPLTWVTPIHGVMSAYSSRSTEAAWINLHVRANQWGGAGHHHNDAGMIHFSALGVDWITESPFNQSYDGAHHNQALVDGKSSSEKPWAAPGVWLGSTQTDLGAAATCDLTAAYTYRWMNQPGRFDANEKVAWELDDSPVAVEAFKGTQRVKMRPWWPSYNFSSWYPPLRSAWNPMRFVYRTAGLVRGAHPYGVVVDDLQKDDATHLYQFCGMLGPNAVRAEVPSLPAGWAALGRRPVTPEKAPKATVVTPTTGDPVLLLVPLDGGTDGAAVETLPGVPDRKGNPTTYDRVVIGRTAVTARLRTALVPWIVGTPLPSVTATADGAVLRWADQEDRLGFTVGDDQRTRLRVTRGAVEVLAGP